ncbi:MAG: glycosyltransferase family 4 protein [Actinobacteria bacterium]|nr:glycosyltransferase family 4 protein [Actinomycetota bacterium]
MKIAFVHFPGRLSRLEAARAGAAPTEFLFGAVELERHGHEIRHHEVDPDAPASRIGRRLVDANAGRGRLAPHLASMTLAGTRRLLPALRSADVVVATTTGTAMALAMWSRAGLLRTPLVGIVAGLLNDPWRRTRRLTTLPLLRRLQLVLYGPGELEGLTAFGLGDRLHVVPFGVDASFWTPGAPTSERDVLAIGNDGHRDWDTLLAAAPTISAPVRIFTRHPPPRTLPDNVTWQPADWHTQVLSDAAVRDLYRQASVVVVPTKDVPQPSGQSVTLQAMATGRPVVLSRTRGLWAPDELRDGGNVMLVPPADPVELAHTVNLLLDDRARAGAIGGAARESVLRDATTARYAERLLEVCRLALAAG